ncbi:mitochondrial acyl carrier protein [Scheffersomyces coipomensis]|uniref:mitochondrial acyl carrier protein n=1 Tax=Scheffersomyces coipomensis TaxID=1788519 RepID=UPI00315D9A6A
MFRISLLRSIQSQGRVAVSRAHPIKSVFAITQTSTTTTPTFIRHYSGFPALTRDVAKERILELLEGYEKTDTSKEIKEESSYIQDLGLDSLDVVEVVMELEHEFNIQIPDNEADSLKTVGQTIDYILAQEDAV